MSNLNVVASPESRAAAKALVRVVGFALGNLALRLYLGEIHKRGRLWTQREREQVAGTDVLVLGGTVGTSGYIGKTLPLLARNRVVALASESAQAEGLAESLIFPSCALAPGDAGAFGAYHLPNMETAREEIARAARRSYDENRLPLLPLLDVGGTKIRLVLAHLTEAGVPTLRPYQAFQFKTPVGREPSVFYDYVSRLIAPILLDLANGESAYDLIPILAMGQPGLFESDGMVGAGSALDLGQFAGAAPATLLSAGLANAGLANFRVYVGNDGRAQFLGLVKGIMETDPALAITLLGRKVAYLGLGTGLGAGYGRIHDDGSLELFPLHNAFDIVADQDWEQLPSDPLVPTALLPQIPYAYGDVLSGKFFAKSMHQIDCARMEDGARLLFVSNSALANTSPAAVRSVLSGPSGQISPLNAALLNDIVDGDTTTSRAEETVELWRPVLKEKLKCTLQAIVDELKKTVVANVRAGAHNT